MDVLAERRRLEAQVKAFEQALKVLEKEIKEAFPDSAVQLSLVGEQVVVRGEAKDAVEAAQILRIVAEHSPTRRRTAVTLSNNVNVNFIPGLGDEAAAVDAIRQLLAGNPNLVNLLRVPGEQQVMLMVTVAEVDRTAARTIGMDFSISKGQFTFAQAITGAAAAAAGNLPVSIDNGNILLAIQALRTMNFARSLAEPNLTTLNGKPANFLAGGSFPIPNSVILPGGAAQSVTYQNFGVSLQFTPYITDRTRIRLNLNASVSTPSTATTSVNGAQVPSQITERQFQTTVELREGQTLAVAGLIQNNFSGTSNRVPLWGDLPLIGRTGGVDSVSSGEQELVVLVTPVLVHPLEHVPDAARARQQPLRAGRPGILSRRAVGKPARGGLPRVGPHRFRAARAVHPPRRPVHHRPAGHDLRLLQLGELPQPAVRRRHSGPRTDSRACARTRTAHTLDGAEDETDAQPSKNSLDRRVVVDPARAGRLRLPRRTEVGQRHHAGRNPPAQRDIRLPVDPCGDGPCRSG